MMALLALDSNLNRRNVWKRQRLELEYQDQFGGSNETPQCLNFVPLVFSSGAGISPVGRHSAQSSGSSSLAVRFATMIHE